MKQRAINNLILTSSILLFSGCSGSTPQVETAKKITKSPSLSAYNIIGINRDRNRAKHIPLFIVAQRPKVERIEDYPEATYFSDIPEPVYNNITSYPTAHSIPVIDELFVAEESVDNNSIEVISYAPTQRQQQRVQKNSYSQNIEVISYASNQSPHSKEKNSFTNHSNLTVIKNEIEAKAKSFLGTKYVWGATGPSKFDCSGFTQWVYRDSGITIPRVSKDQAKVGGYVQYENLRRGDMVFFDTKKRRAGKVTHVGIYLGNNNFIHASSGAKKVIIYNFNDKPFYKDRFLWGRRVINNNSYLASK
ncbi:MAG: C40 family peptidase [Sulfurovaceae bacterium]|nr:C40 family peptidase [Sulfurovaceae bacterium]